MAKSGKQQGRQGSPRVALAQIEELMASSPQRGDALRAEGLDGLIAVKRVKLIQARRERARVAVRYGETSDRVARLDRQLAMEHRFLVNTRAEASRVATPTLARDDNAWQVHGYLRSQDGVRARQIRGRSVRRCGRTQVAGRDVDRQARLFPHPAGDEGRGEGQGQAAGCAGRTPQTTPKERRPSGRPLPTRWRSGSCVRFGAPAFLGITAPGETGSVVDARPLYPVAGRHRLPRPHGGQPEGRRLVLPAQDPAARQLEHARAARPRRTKSRPARSRRSGRTIASTSRTRTRRASSATTSAPTASARSARSGRWPRSRAAQRRISHHFERPRKTMRALASRSKEQSTPLKKGGPRTQPVHASPLFSQSTGGDSGVVQRKAGCACGGDCPKCRSELGIQAKLKVGAPNDKYEQEADRVAERIVSDGSFSPTKVDHAHNHVQRGMSASFEEEETEANAVQRKANSDGNSKMPAGTESYIQSLGGGGRPLSRTEAQYYEPRFDQSFNDVRIHTGAAADQAAKSINARAFTLGKNIAFADGEYDSSSDPGRRLMAHELTHTLQQSTGVSHVQRGSAGILGGKCCLRASRVEWALAGAGVWKKLEQGQCTGTTEDCDGMTCGGGFYRVDNGQTGSCSTPRHDDATFTPRRWTPNAAGASATSPTQEGSAGGDTPPNWVYDSAATTPCPNGVRTITVDFVTLDGATQSPASQLATANAAYSGCCVQFVAGANSTTGIAGNHTRLARRR